MNATILSRLLTQTDRELLAEMNISTSQPDIVVRWAGREYRITAAILEDAQNVADQAKHNVYIGVDESGKEHISLNAADLRKIHCGYIMTVQPE